MYLKHTDPYGNELGYYRSIKEASERIGAGIDLLTIAVKHKLELNDGTKLCKATLNNTERRQVKERKRQALQEWIRLGTHPNFLARKYHLQVQDVCRAIEAHKNEQKLHEAYTEYLISSGNISRLASKHDVSAWSLSARIKRCARS